MLALGAAACLATAQARAAYFSTCKYALTAETRVGPPPNPPVNDSLLPEINSVVLGQDLQVRTPALVDATGAPLADIAVEFVLTAPSGATHTLIWNSDAQGVAQGTIPAAYLNEIGSYRLRTRVTGLPTTTRSFLVLKRTAGPVTVGPNPFSPSDPVFNQVHFVLPEAAAGNLKVFRLDGIKIYEYDFPAGAEAVWAGADRAGQRVRGGVYLWQITSSGKKYTGTVVVVR